MARFEKGQTPWNAGRDIYEDCDIRTLYIAYHYYVAFKKKMPSGIVWGYSLNKRIVS